MTITLGSGPDGRVVAEYLARRKRMRESGEDYSTDDINEVWLDLARKYKRPIRELKDLVNQYMTEQNPNRPLNPPERLRHRACGCGETENIEWRTNPYSVEIYGNFSKRWMCPRCVHNSAMDI